jgi:hypothetical protein
LSEKQGDHVYTPDWVVVDMVSHFRPEGLILDPCRGKGAFTDRLPEDTFWCEIDDGRDFFEWREAVDWVIGNPPYSLTRPFFKHSYEVADNILYLVPLRNVFSGYGFVKEIHEYGGIKEIRVYGTGGKLGFPMGNAVGAFHLERGYCGPTTFSLPVLPVESEAPTWRGSNAPPSPHPWREWHGAPGICATYFCYLSEREHPKP